MAQLEAEQSRRDNELIKRVRRIVMTSLLDHPRGSISLLIACGAIVGGIYILPTLASTSDQDELAEATQAPVITRIANSTASPNPIATPTARIAGKGVGISNPSKELETKLRGLPASPSPFPSPKASPGSVSLLFPNHENPAGIINNGGISGHTRGKD